MRIHEKITVALAVGAGVDGACRCAADVLMPVRLSEPSSSSRVHHGRGLLGENEKLVVPHWRIWPWDAPPRESYYAPPPPMPPPPTPMPVALAPIMHPTRPTAAPTPAPTPSPTPVPTPVAVAPSPDSLAQAYAEGRWEPWMVEEQQRRDKRAYDREQWIKSGKSAEEFDYWHPEKALFVNAPHKNYAPPLVPSDPTAATTSTGAPEPR